ncbi:hypothetical protein ACLOJK_028575 [Asimina triloba]
MVPFSPLNLSLGVSFSSATTCLFDSVKMTEEINSGAASAMDGVVATTAVLQWGCYGGLPTTAMTTDFNEPCACVPVVEGDGAVYPPHAADFGGPLLKMMLLIFPWNFDGCGQRGCWSSANFLIEISVAHQSTTMLLPPLDGATAAAGWSWVPVRWAVVVAVAGWRRRWRREALSTAAVGGDEGDSLWSCWIEVRNLAVDQLDDFDQPSSASTRDLTQRVVPVIFLGLDCLIGRRRRACRQQPRLPAIDEDEGAPNSGAPWVHKLPYTYGAIYAI